MSVVRNTGYNFAAMLVPTLVALVTLPLYIHTMGEERYGVIALVTALIGYFGLFDFGLSAASAQRIAAADPDDIAARRSIFWTAAGINLALGLLGALLLAPIAWVFFGSAEGTSAELRAEINGSIVWIALALPIMLLSGVLRGALQGAGRFAEMNLINVVMGPATQIIPLLVAIYVSPSLIWVLPTLYFVRLLALAMQAIVVAKRVIHGWTPCFDRSRVRDLLSFGGWVTLSAVVDPLLTTIDRFVIGSFLGMKSVSHYTVPYQLAQRSLIVPSALLDAMLPRLAGANEAEALGVSKRGMRAVVALMTPPMIAGIAFIHSFLSLWISRDFADSAALPAQFMLAGCWFNAIGFCCFQHLRARGRPRLIAIAHLIEIPPYLLCLWAGMYFYGLAGAAAAFAVRVAFDDALLAWFGGLWAEFVKLIAIAAPALALAFWVGAGVAGSTTLFSPSVIAAALLILASSLAALAWLYGQRETLRAAFRFRRAVSE